MTPNWIDLALGALILLSIIVGWRRGFVFTFLDLASWLLGLLPAFRFYHPAAQWVTAQFDWPAAWTRPAAFLGIFFAALLVLRIAATMLVARLPAAIHRHPGNRLLGILPGFADGMIYAIVVATLLLTLPFPERLQQPIRDSALANRLAAYGEIAEARLRPVFDEAIAETLNMLRIAPQSKETVKLPFTVKESAPLPALEAKMLDLVNHERQLAGLRPLAMDDALTHAARQHSADMLARGYFSHYSPEGQTAADRLRADQIRFLIAGENLAFAPTVTIAHTGLMQSPGHRANILRPQFGKVGIGIMDAGYRGIMVTQKFSN